MRHTLYWSVPYMISLEMRLEFQGASSLYFNRIIKLTLTSSRLQSQMGWNHHNYGTISLVENEAHLVLECPLYNLIRNENGVMGSLESFFQLNHQDDIDLY